MPNILDLPPEIRDKKLANMGMTIEDYKRWRAEKEAAEYPEPDPNGDPKDGWPNDASFGRLDTSE